MRDRFAPSAALAANAGAAGARAWELDALRGLMLVLMTITHLPTRFAGPLGQPFGFVSAAEGFVLLSACMAGRVYMNKNLRQGEQEMRGAFLRRACKVYLTQAALLVFLLGLIALLGAARSQEAVLDLLSFYWDQPLRAFASGLLLLYNPPLLDILPMYIVFMVASPLLLLHGLRQGWSAILAVSIALWVAAQFGLGTALYDQLVTLSRLQLPPVQQTGSFSILAWQFLWVLGLWLGANSVARGVDAAPAMPRAFPRWLVVSAAALAATGMLWRHSVGQAPFGADVALNLLFDKWTLGPLRMINLFALLVLVLHFAPALRRLPRVGVLERFGQAGLAVFVTHLAAALLALALLGRATPERPVWVDLALLGASFAAMYAVAWATGWLEGRQRRARHWARAFKAGELRSHAATVRSPPH